MGKRWGRMGENWTRSEERRGGKEWRSLCDWSSDVCSSDLNIGYNANTGEYVDMFAAGIIDPRRVTRTALQNAASVSGLMLTTEALVAADDLGGVGWAKGGGGWVKIGPDRKSVVEGKSGDHCVTGVQTCALPILTSGIMRIRVSTWTCSLRASSTPGGSPAPPCRTRPASPG